MINDQIRIPINGVRQYISIRSEQERAPLLLYLHGGPGYTALPLVLKYNRELECSFTVAVWEQRGAGKSYYPFRPDETITIDTFLQDLLELTQYLLDHFHQKKLYLVGHSWGSVLGLRFIQHNPEYVYSYIGCGQVVNMKKSWQIARNFAIKQANGKEKEKLKQIDPVFTGEKWLEDLLFLTKQITKFGGSLYGKTNQNSLIPPFLLSKYYSLPDLIRRQKGSVQSLRRLWSELMEVNFEPILSYEVPVIFAEGHHDYHVSFDLVKRYYDTLQSEKRFIWFEQSGHFPQWSEANKFNQLVTELVKGKLEP